MKATNEINRCQLVESPEAARMLTDPKELQIPWLFMGQERSLKAAAEILGWPTLRVYRRVRRLVELGVLRISRMERARGSARHFYTATANAFFIPFRLTPYESYEAYLLANDECWRKLLYAGLSKLAKEQTFGELGKYIFVDAQGRVRDIVAGSPQMASLPEEISEPPTVGVWNDWSWVCLEASAAKALQLELVELFKRYTAQHSPGQQGYIVRMAIAPVAE